MQKSFPQGGGMKSKSLSKLVLHLNGVWGGTLWVIALVAYLILVPFLLVCLGFEKLINTVKENRLAIKKLMANSTNWIIFGLAISMISMFIHSISMDLISAFFWAFGNFIIAIALGDKISAEEKIKLLKEEE